MKAEAVSQWWSQTKRLLAALPRGLPTLAPLRSLLVDFGVILVMIVLFVSIVLQVADPAPVADPISVPKSLADVGYSAEVVTTRLIDRSRAIEQANNAGIDRTSAAAATTGDANLLSTVTVPSAGVSLAVVVAGVRRFIGLPSRHIGGYIVIDNGGGGGYRMTVRVSGRDAPLEYTGKANASIEHVIEHGARALAPRHRMGAQPPGPALFRRRQVRGCDQGLRRGSSAVSGLPERQGESRCGIARHAGLAVAPIAGVKI